MHLIVQRNFMDKRFYPLICGCVTLKTEAVIEEKKLRMSDQNEPTVYEMVGGAPTFRKLVDLFYAKVEADTLLRAMFPDDLEPGKEWQYLFLMQFFGGPTDYGAVRGHPRLRMRHAPFPIDQASRDAWLKHMLDSIDEIGIGEPARGIMREYFERASAFMINVESRNDGT